MLVLLVGTALQSTKAFVPLTFHSSSRAAVPKQQLVLRALDVASLDTFVETQPYLAAFLMCSLKASAADAVAQLRALANMHTPPPTAIQANSNNNHQQNQQQQQLHDEQTALFSSLDIPRNIAFVLYGGLWQGLFQTFLFTNIYPHLFGVEHTWTSVAAQVLFDTTFMGPCVFLPVCYSVKSLFSAGNNNCTNLLDCVPTGLAKYHHDVTQKGLLQLFWSIWIPAQVLNFSVVPTHWRVLFVAAVSFFWVCALSTISSSSPDSIEKSDDMPNKIEENLAIEVTEPVISITRTAFAAGSFPQQRLNEF